MVEFGGGGFATISYASYLYKLVVNKHISGKTIFRGTSLGSFWAVCAAVMSGDRRVMSFSERKELFLKMCSVLVRFCENVHCGWFASRGMCKSYFDYALSLIPDILLEDIGKRVQMFTTKIEILKKPLKFLSCKKVILTGFKNTTELAESCAASQYIPLWTMIVT